jgi:transcriptional regulator NrdR family protein
MITDAILKINPNAQVSVSGSDIDTCEITWHDGTTPISKEDIKAMIPTVEQELKDAEAKKINDKATAKSKLKALGLTDDEVEALQG